MTDPTSAGPDQWRFDDLGVLYINCTLKRSPEPSHRQVLQADILVLCGPIWLGDNSSVAKRVIERLYACSSLLNDAGWIGEAGPGPSSLDPGSGGPENDFTNRSTAFATWNLMHLGALLRRAGGIPAHGNQRSEREAGCRSTATTPSTADLREVSLGPLGPISFKFGLDARPEGRTKELVVQPATRPRQVLEGCPTWLC
jgi:hypothetical protein